MKKINKKIDLLVVTLILGITATISYILDVKPLIAGLLYLLIPSIYLILREKKNFLKIFWATIIFGSIGTFIVDVVAVFNEAYVVQRITFPLKIFGFYPIIDHLIVYSLMAMFVVIFYEHFLDDEKNRRISKNLIWALTPALVILTSILVIYFINPSILKIPYFYLVVGIICIIPAFIITLSKPRFLEKFLKVAAFFFIVWFVFELIGLKGEGWFFPGQYIGRVEIAGVQFPFEELFFWMMLYAATIVSYYEFFIDDKK